MAQVLIADDDPLTCGFVKKALEFGGHSVSTAADGLEAIAQIRTMGCFDAVITDYAMPRANGIDVIAHTHRVDPTIPCIIVTAYRDLDLAVQAIRAGAVGFIPKPFKAEHLLAVVSTALERRHITGEAIRLRLLAPMLENLAVMLANTLESKDYATGEHARRLVDLSSGIAEHIGMSEEARSSIRLGACLHDIGKVSIPEELLRKPGPLNDEEFALMRTHPEVGAAILESIDTWEEIRKIVRHHHERFDGRGYPDRLTGREIPTGARIVGVVDAYDVMRTGRPYCVARDPEAIIVELNQQRGAQFDPEMVDALLAVLSVADFAEPEASAVGSVRPRPVRAGVDVLSWIEPEPVPVRGLTARR